MEQNVIWGNVAVDDPAIMEVEDAEQALKHQPRYRLNVLVAVNLNGVVE